MNRLSFSWAVFAIVVLGLRAAAPAVAPKPLYRDPVYDGAADPTLIWNRAAHRWVMFYTNRRASAGNLPGVSWVHGTRIGMAESTDGGVAWKYKGTANINYGKPDYTHWAQRSSGTAASITCISASFLAFSTIGTHPARSFI